MKKYAVVIHAGKSVEEAKGSIMLTLEQKNKLFELAAKNEFAVLRIGKYIYRYRNGRFERAVAGRPAPWVTVEYL